MQLIDALESYAESGGPKCPATIARIRAAIRALRLTLGREPELSDLNAEQLARFHRDRIRRGRAVNTVRGECFKLLALANWGVSHGHCQPVEFAPPAPVIESPIAFTESELRRMMIAATLYRGTINGTPGSVFLLGLIGVIWDTGERIGAVRALLWPSVNVTDRWVTFPARTRKGGCAGRTRRISVSTAKQLAILQAELQPGPFTGAHKQTVYNHFRRLLIGAGLPHDRQHMTHALRRSHASYLALAGGDAAASLGHSTEAMTRKHYFDPRITEAVAACDLLPRIDQPLRPWWRFW
jgi:integrase